MRALEPLRSRVTPGMSVAITAGSRGIHDKPAVVRAAGQWLRSLGADPFVVPAMGSHGGATAEEQVQMLADLGMTEETLGMPIHATMETIELDRLPDGPAVHLDANAAKADGILAVNRVKAHTDFKGEIEGGLAKIVAIGLGKQRGAEGVHLYGPANLGVWIPQVARRIVETGKVLGGLAIIENAYDRAAKVELVGAQDIGGHKLAVAPVAVGEPVRKYNQIIGFATVPIEPGDHVHTHNVEFKAFERDYAFGADVVKTPMVPESERATFQGIVRADGRVATRNYIGILTSVNCSATTAKLIADQFRSPGLLDDFENVDGVVALVHGAGCGMASEGEGFDVLQRTLTGYAEHPNFAGFLLLGLGCEVNQVSSLAEKWTFDSTKLVETMTIQEQGGTAATVRAGVGAIREMLPVANG